MNAPQKKLVIVTPVGIGSYPWLNTPDVEFDAAGVYHTKLQLDADGAVPLITQLQGLVNERVEQLKAKGKKVVKTASLPWTITDDGAEFKFKLKASGKNGATGEDFVQKPKLFNADKSEFTGIVTNGSTLRIAFYPVVFDNAALGAGITLRIKSVQVLKVAPMQSKAAADFGDGTADAPSSAQDESYDF